MIEEQTFQEHLERLLKVTGEDANPLERTLCNKVKINPLLTQSPNYDMEMLAAKRGDKKERMLYDEDFILGPLQPNITLHNPLDLIDVVIKFYSTQGWDLFKKDRSLESNGRILNFRNNKRYAIVQLGLGEGFRTDGNYELWVSTFSSPY
jgi:hypothetical protein